KGLFTVRASTGAGRASGAAHQAAAQVVQLLEGGVADDQFAAAAAVLELNLQAEGVGQVLLQGQAVGGGRLAAARLAPPGPVGPALGQFLGLADVEAVGHDLFGQSDRLGGGDQGAGVAGAEPAGGQMI